MGRIQYYLVNETKKEFCFFNARIPIHDELKRIMENWSSWVATDSIKIYGEEESKGPDLWEHLTINLEYRDLDYDKHACN